jgi:hypothetical protein
MPVLPSGRRIEYSLDRFHALLARMPLADAQRTVAALKEPNDLLYVLDVVAFDRNGEPYFANAMAHEFEVYALTWPAEDQDALAAWVESETARYYRSVAIREIHDMVSEVAECARKLPQAA